MIIKFGSPGKEMYFRTLTGLIDSDSEKITEQEASADIEGITLFCYSEAYIKKMADIERAWRNEQLKICDIEVNKGEDAAGTFNASTWRAYRQKLRDWPENENFPDIAFRPLTPS